MFLNKQIIQLGVVGFLLVVEVLFSFGMYKNDQMRPLEVSFLDIGQGDSILISYLHRYQILIDGGPDGKKVLTELSKVMPFMDNKIEVVIITHPDRDHFSGLLDVVKKYKIGVVLDNGQISEDELWVELYKLIKEKKIKTKSILEGSKLEIDNEIFVKFFNPDKIEKDKKAKNDSSVVARLDYKKNSFLFTGDAGFDAEADMVFDHEDVDVDFLKVGHHGSKYSSSDFFLARVTPKWSIISVGENKYGHPTMETINRLKKINSKILRTDELGTITIQCERSECKVKLR